jgi:hypothetical protein
VKFEARIFLVVGVFLWLAAAGYLYVTSLPNEYTHGHIEVVGVAGLILSGGLMFICGGFFWFVSRRIDPRPEDREDGEIAEAAGELGFFSPGSYWPIGIAGAATVAGLGLAFFEVWLALVGVVLILFTVSGLVFEYYIGGRRFTH